MVDKEKMALLSITRLGLINCCLP